jgi:hypothetical protein
MLIKIEYERYFLPEAFGVSSYDELPAMPETKVYFDGLMLAGHVRWKSASAGRDGAHWNDGQFDVYKDQIGQLFILKKEEKIPMNIPRIKGFPVYREIHTFTERYEDKEVGDANSCKNPRYWHGKMEPVKSPLIK